jgi:Zn-dependent peptidase ImmA (M78 family)
LPVRLAVSPAVIKWAVARSGVPSEKLEKDFKISAWTHGRLPTLNKLTEFASRTGVPFGYLLLDEPPTVSLPVPDFRVGFRQELTAPSVDLLAVLNQSIRRQDWYRDFAVSNDLPPIPVVGSAKDRTPEQAAEAMRKQLGYEVIDRKGSWDDNRKALLRAFERVGGLTVCTSMVGNNTHRPLNPDEFRGFALVDDLAPLIFVNAAQSINGQIFTIAHELAHIWRGQSGIGNEEPRIEGDSEIERWCNSTAAEFLVPTADLRQRFGAVAEMPLVQQLDRLAAVYRCGTLVILQALRRNKLRKFKDFDRDYEEEEKRLKGLAEKRPGGGGDHYNNQPFRIGARLSDAVISDTLEGRTSFSEALSLLSMKSQVTFDEYARRLGAA